MQAPAPAPPVILRDTAAARPAPRSSVEWPTWLVIFLVHAAWLALLAAYQTLGPVLAAPLLVVALTWHGSMSHEIVHGHPTRVTWFNDLLAQWPVALLTPYFLFKENHLMHHHNERLTLPGIDPESFFIRPAAWRQKGRLGRALAWANMTMAGRLALDPARAVWHLLRHIGRGVRERDHARSARFLIHCALATAVVMSAERWFAVPPAHYLVIAYLSHSLLWLRAFFEHRPHPDAAKRSVIVESNWLFQILFLNNNFHAVHHIHPQMPWYQLKSEYHRHRARYLQENGHFAYRGYRDWMKYLCKPVAAPWHPHPPE